MEWGYFYQPTRCNFRHRSSISSPLLSSDIELLFLAPLYGWKIQIVCILHESDCSKFPAFGGPPLFCALAPGSSNGRILPLPRRISLQRPMGIFAGRRSTSVLIRKLNPHVPGVGPTSPLFHAEKSIPHEHRATCPDEGIAPEDGFNICICLPYVDVSIDSVCAFCSWARNAFIRNDAIRP